MLARSQGGVFSHEQAVTSGLSAWQVGERVRRGRWQRVRPRVYADASLPPHGRTALHLALLCAGAGSALSHLTAGRLWGMVDERTDRTGGIDVTVPPRHRPDCDPDVRVHRIPLGPERVGCVEGLRLTDRTRTVFDCLTVLPRARGRTLLDRSLQRGWTTVGALGDELNGRRRVGAPRVRELLDEARPGADSEAERRAHALLVGAGLTGWTAGYPWRRYVLDIAFPAARLAIEIDGYAYHSDPARFQHDRRRQNELVAARWTVLRFTWADIVERPHYVIETIAGSVSHTPEKTGVTPP